MCRVVRSTSGWPGDGAPPGVPGGEGAPPGVPGGGAPPGVPGGGAPPGVPGGGAPPGSEGEQIANIPSSGKTQKAVSSLLNIFGDYMKAKTKQEEAKVSSSGEVRITKGGKDSASAKKAKGGDAKKPTASSRNR